MENEENKVLQQDTSSVEGFSGEKKFRIGLASAINNTYSYANSSLFYGLMPPYYRDYAWRYVRIALQWLDGYVLQLHGYDSGIVSTRIASELISGLTRQIVGEKLLFRKADENATDESVGFISKWSKENNITRAIYSAVGWALATGTSLMKINKTSSGELWIESIRFDRCYYRANHRNQVEDATFMIKSYVDTTTDEKKANSQFFLVEKRYYSIRDKADVVKKLDGTFEVIHPKGERVPMVEYQVYRTTGTTYINTMPTAISGGNRCKWEEIPLKVRDMIKRDYGIIRFDEPQMLGFTNLGVEILMYGNIDLTIPTGTLFGKSLLVGIQTYLITYEVACSYLLRDMYLGKGTVYVPKNMSQSDYLANGVGNSGVLNDLGENKIELIKGLDPQDQKMIVDQFELRVEDWSKAKANALRDIATCWGMSPKILASYLGNGRGNTTATEIDSEDDLSLSFIYTARSNFKDNINRLIETVMNYYGRPCNVLLDFSSPSVLNKDRLIDRVIKKLESGLTDVEDAVREIYPDLDEKQLQAKVKIVVEQRERIRQDKLASYNSFETYQQGGNEQWQQKLVVQDNNKNLTQEPESLQKGE